MKKVAKLHKEKIHTFGRLVLFSSKFLESNISKFI